MPRLEIEADSHAPPLVFRAPRNWTAVAFFGALGSLHLGMAITSYTSYQSILHMSIIFGAIFIAIALTFLVARHEVTIDPQRRRVSMRTGVGRLAYCRGYLFSNINSVRVTLLGRLQGESSVSIMCACEEIELPPTRTPRQEALLLAMTIGVRLVKVYGEGASDEAVERIARLYRNEDAI